MGSLTVLALVFGAAEVAAGAGQRIGGRQVQAAVDTRHHFSRRQYLRWRLARTFLSLLLCTFLCIFTRLFGAAAPPYPHGHQQHHQDNEIFHARCNNTSSTKREPT